AIYHDAASMGVGNLLNEVQPDPEADEVRILLGLDPGKPLEELAMMAGVDAKAVIHDAQDDVGAGAAHPHTDAAGGRRTKSNRIVKELADRQVQPGAVALDGCVQYLEVEVNRQIGEAPLLILDDSLDQLDQVDALGDNRAGELVEPPDQAHVGDQPA